VPGRSSLETILDEARSERAIQLRHFDALDARAGVILGFAGVLVALFPGGSPLIDVGRLAAVTSGLLALWTFSQRPETGVDLSPLMEQYSEADPDFTVRRLIQAHVELTDVLRRLLQVKVVRPQGIHDYPRGRRSPLFGGSGHRLMTVSKMQDGSRGRPVTGTRPSGQSIPPFPADIRLITSFEGENTPEAKAKAQAYILGEWERRQRERLYGPDPSWIRRLLRRLTIIR
jgi:hypothetical protein